MPEVAPSISGKDILIVDDTINNVRLLADMLSDAGFSVRKALSGSMALIAIQSSLPDLVLLDINMPVMNGYEICDRLKQDPSTQDIPIIFLSALDTPAHKVKAFQVGGTDYITKPFQAEEVIARIQHQLHLRQLQSALETKNQALRQTLAQLKALQAELIQKQKMIGLSQLIAGIAHEINNPISFIVGNLQPARTYFDDLLTILYLYRRHYPEPVPEIEAAIATIDLDFIIQDFPNLLQSMEIGTVRICSIIQALQTFSHHGLAAIKTIDLHPTIDSILVLLQARLRGQGNRPTIQVVTDYGDLPTITCEAKSISQALFNLLDNAIDAIDAKWAHSPGGEQAPGAASHPEPMIWITTGTTPDQQVSVAIRDNGIGIADDIRARIYEPFFSTKAIGQGNGLGLSTAYQILVTQHRGSLNFDSSLYEGSEFVVTIPPQAG